jgi:2'-5' RNA ligase
MSQKIRAFIAFELPADVLSALKEIQQQLNNFRFRVKWLRPENIHLTLKFLGEIESDRIDVIADSIFDAASGYDPLSLAAKGVGVFPGMKRPRVIWAGLVGQIELLRDLQQKLDDRLAEAGLARERRPFRGHLTLGRFKGHVSLGEIRQALEEFNHFETAAFSASHLVLFQSELRPEGAVYTKLKSIVVRRIS